MFNLTVRGVIEVVKNSEFEGKKSSSVQMIDIGENNVNVISIKLLPTEKIEDLKIGKNVEIDVKIFTPKDKKDVFYSRTSLVKYVK